MVYEVTCGLRWTSRVIAKTTLALKGAMNSSFLLRFEKKTKIVALC